MRVGLFSPHYAFNYGAVLQAYALKKYLTNQGYDAIILNRRPSYQCAIPSMLGRLARIIEVFSKKNSFGNFEKNYLQPQTSLIVLESDWERFNSFGLDAVIVGSDQVWRDDYAFNSFGYNLFLDFIQDDTKRIAYAPSLGKSSWKASPEIECKVKALLQKFDKISVREDSGVEILKNKFGVDAQLVVDPTLLLDSQDYISDFHIRSLGKKYIGAYILDCDKDIRSQLEFLSHRMNMPLRLIGMESPKSAIGILLNRFMPVPSVLKWLENIANAEYVITNSFHGMVFSIIFRKQFIAIMNSERGGDRFKSLLRMFGLENRLVNSVKEYESVFNSRIDYSDIEISINYWRNKSFKFLKDALSV